MNKTEREQEYSQILDSLQKIRGGIVEDSQQELMFTGMMPPAAQKELKVVADITAAVFNGLSNIGKEITTDPSNESLAVIEVAGRSYSCLKMQLTSAPTHAAVITKATQVAPPLVREEPAKAVPVEEEPAWDDTSDALEVEEPAPVESPIEDNNVEEEYGEDGPEITVSYPEDTDNDIKDEFAVSPNGSAASIDEYLPKDQVYSPEPEQIEAPVIPRYTGVKEEGSGVVDLSDGDDDSSVIPNEPITEAPVITGKAKVIGGGPVNVNVGIDKEEFFMDEQRKAEGEFVYCFSKISVMHTDMGGGGKPEEMLVLVAPLKIFKFASTSVPIVVTIVHNGKSVTASSYDILEEGKNIVTIDIDEFYFLCRGSFDDKGRFKASIVTTGISSQQNDRITPLFSKTYGNGAAKETRNGHIKFHYTAESGPGSVEVIPFGVQGDRSEDFVAIVKNKEFVDYYLVSKSLKANTKAIIYSEGGVMNELVCHWEDDVLIADLI